jgi:hypothetical protein
MKAEEQFQIRMYSKSELAQLYRCSTKTFMKYVQRFEKEIGPSFGYSFSPRQVEEIVKRLGRP